jgi:hypothetical protein
MLGANFLSDELSQMCSLLRLTGCDNQEQVTTVGRSEQDKLLVAVIWDSHLKRSMYLVKLVKTVQ